MVQRGNLRFVYPSEGVVDDGQRIDRRKNKGQQWQVHGGRRTSITMTANNCSSAIRLDGLCAGQVTGWVVGRGGKIEKKAVDEPLARRYCRSEIIERKDSAWQASFEWNGLSNLGEP
jgi:hypothetical protein